LKERLFGLNGSQGNHGEDAKEYWWYLDAVPSHAWNHWRYHYPQAPYPYEDLLAVNGARGRTEPEYELLDTGIFDDDRYWVVDVLYAKSSPTDLLMEIDITNAGPKTETLHVLPTAWFRNTWSWQAGADKPTMSADGSDLSIDHPWLGSLEMKAGPGPMVRLRNCSSAKTRRTSSGCTGQHSSQVPQGRHQRPRGPWRQLGQSGADGYQGVLLVPRHRRGR